MKLTELLTVLNSVVCDFGALEVDGFLIKGSKSFGGLRQSDNSLKGLFT
jgi:hypothetical protein